MADVNPRSGAAGADVRQVAKGVARPASAQAAAPAAAPAAAHAPAAARDRVALSGATPIAAVPDDLPNVAELTKLRAIREQAQIMLDQGARDGRYVPTEWLSDATRNIARKGEGAQDPLIRAIADDARAALAEAEGKTGEGEAAGVLAAFLRSVEARTGAGVAQPREVLVGVRTELEKAVSTVAARPAADREPIAAAARSFQDLVAQATRVRSLQDAIDLVRDGLALAGLARAASEESE